MPRPSLKLVLAAVVATGLIIIADAIWGINDVEQNMPVKTAPPPVGV